MKNTALAAPLPRLALTLALFAAAAGGAQAQLVWHVKADAPPGGDGLSWATAFVRVQDGLDVAQPGDEVWVAAGLYRPTKVHSPSDPRSARFELLDGVGLYGGFRGDETALAQRAGLFAHTILDGDLGVPGDPTDNAYHVVRLGGDVPFYHPQGLIDGFLIRNGYGGPGRRGGGVRVTGTAGANSWPIVDLRNCIVRGNASERGGGLAVDNFARVRVGRCTFEQNSSTLNGGALNCRSGWVWSYDTVWRDNVTLGEGGAIYTASNASASMRFVNDLFHGNRAAQGGVAFIASTTFFQGVGKFANCTVADNVASVGGAFLAQPGGRLKVWNSIVWSNQAAVDPQISGSGPDVSVQHSDVQGGFVGPGNLDVDPQFLDLGARDLRTRAGSPVHDAGSQSLVANDDLDQDGDGLTQEPTPLDHAGRRRAVDDPLAPDVGSGSPPVDLGAWEHQGAP